MLTGKGGSACGGLLIMIRGNEYSPIPVRAWEFGLARRVHSAVPSRVSLFILHTQAEPGAYLRDSSRVPRRRPFIYIKPPFSIGSVPSLSGHAIAYRWRSLPRVRRHMASKPQGSFERVLPWQVTMDQLICASLSHTHYWYEVGMLKVLANTIHICRRQPILFVNACRFLFRDCVCEVFWEAF